MVYVARGCSVVGIVGLLALGSACGLDLSSDATDTDGSSGADADVDDDAESTAGETSGVTGPSDGDTTDPTGGGGQTTGDEPGGTGADDEALCDDVDCSNAGYCEVGDDGPTCTCNDGFASVGLDCIPCEVIAAGTLPAAVPALQASFSFTVDGVEPSESPYEEGHLSLRNRITGDLVELGSTRHQTSSVLMVPGVYDVLYRHSEGQDMPRNSAAVLGQIEVRDDGTPINLDVPIVELKGAIAFASGDEPSSPAYDHGTLWLVDPRNGDRVKLGDTRDDSYTVRVVPGKYEVHYTSVESQGNAPFNSDGLLRYIDTDDGLDHEADILVDAVRISGALLIDGSWVDSAYDHGKLSLRAKTTGEVLPLGDTRDGAYQLTVLPGEYEVLYSVVELGDDAPGNRDTVVDALSVGSDDIEYDIDLHTATVRGTFTLNGLEPPTEAYDDGIVELQGAAGGTVVLGNTHDGTYARRVLVGNYSAFYSQDTAGVSMPVNTHAQLDPVDVRGDLIHDVDIAVTEVVGTLTIDGNEAPDAPYDDGRLFLRNRDTGDSALLGNTREGVYAARVVPGTYDVVYENEFSDEFLPVNRGAVLQADIVVAAGDAPLDIDVPVSTMQGSVEIEGSTPEPSEGIGQLFLRDVESDDAVFIGHTGAASFSKPLTDGTYIMEYRGVPAEGSELGVSLPANAAAAFACYEIASE